MADGKLKVLFLTRYARLGASSRYRFLQYFPDLEKEGISCAFSPLLDDRYLDNLYHRGGAAFSDFSRALWRRLSALLSLKGYDLLVVEKEVLIYFPPWLERMLVALGIPYLVDYDDAIFHQYDQHPRLLIRALLRDKIATVMKGARVVTVGNDYLAAYARRAGARHVEVLPTVVDLALYPQHPPPPRDSFVIGWIGSPCSSVSLPGIASALAEVCRGGRARVVLVGAGNRTLDGVPVESLPWREESEVADIAGFDVGIMPLLDDPWARGKCGFKLIQYMACGLPVVASPLGVNCAIVEHGKNGYLSESSAEWAAALTALRDDRQRRQEMGREGRARVERLYAKEVTAPRFARLLRFAAGREAQLDYASAARGQEQAHLAGAPRDGGRP